jgi:hypothetical protein
MDVVAKRVEGFSLKDYLIVTHDVSYTFVTDDEAMG